MSELNPEQRWIFIGILLLAGDSEIPGTVFRRKDEDGNLVGYMPIILADTLDVSPDVIEPALARMVEKGKIRIDERGVIYVLNWNKYQSEYERKKAGRTNVRPRGGQKSGLDIEGEGDGEGEEDLSASISSIVEKWNKFAKAKDIPWIDGVTPGSTREKHLKARIRAGFDIDKILEAISYQPFLLGENKDGWMVTFDWFVGSPGNLQKILEGNYTKIRRGDAARRAPDDPRTGGRR